MTECVVNRDMFGRYCRIPTGTSGDIHTYKIVSRIDSNGYCDVPLTPSSKEIPHNKIVPVLLVIHCGIDESRVHRVALSDCEIVPAADVAEAKHGRWKKRGNEKTCSCCKFIYYSNNDTWNYCPKCGARMDSEDGE